MKFRSEIGDSMYYIWTVIFRRTDAVEAFYATAMHVVDAVDAIVACESPKIRDWKMEDVDSITRGNIIAALAIRKI